MRSLLTTDCPQWADASLAYLRSSGTDNAMWRIRLDNEPDVVVRLPRRPGAAAGVEQEVSVLQHIAQSRVASLVNTPTVRHRGQPHEAFAFHWSALQWIEGSDAWTARAELSGPVLTVLAHELAQAVRAIGEVTGTDVAQRQPGSRGGPLGPLLDRLDGWLNDPQWHADGLIDVAAVKRLAAEALEVVDEPVTAGFVHGDLIPGNLLVDDARLAAIIDWGGAGWGDPAQDLAPAWAVLTPSERPAFREALEADDATWLRGRTFELEHAVGAILYYTPRHHPLAKVMAHTLHNILSSP